MLDLIFLLLIIGAEIVVLLWLGMSIIKCGDDIEGGEE